MARALLIAVVAAGAFAATCATAGAQVARSSAAAVFRIEEDPDAPGSRRNASGWIYNDGQAVVGLVRLKLQVLDASGQVVAEQMGWAYGNVRPGGRAYFRIAIPAQGESRRITVESYVLQRFESP